MKSIASIVAAFTATDIQRIEQEQQWSGMVGEETIRLDLADFEIVAQDIPGWLVASEGNVTVALDITVSDVLRKEGIAREVVNRVQNARKDTGLDVTDRISIRIDTNEGIQQAIKTHEAYICAEVLANEISFVPLHETGMGTDILEANDTRIELQVI
jgi:isoleucyl-tRNA synthetase